MPPIWKVLVRKSEKGFSNTVVCSYSGKSCGSAIRLKTEGVTRPNYKMRTYRQGAMNEAAVFPDTTPGRTPW